MLIEQTDKLLHCFYILVDFKYQIIIYNDNSATEDDLGPLKEIETSGYRGTLRLK